VDDRSPTGFSPSRIFISYARSDGRAFAEAFEKRLADETVIRSWRDLKDMEGGEILPQVLRAIEEVEHLVLILTRRALESDWIKREWTHAREKGRKVSPVLADPTIKRSDLYPWIRRSEVFDIAVSERWRKLVRVLEGPGETRCVPYMSGHLSEGFVPRPAEYEAIKTAVLAPRGERTVALTTALRGAGGYGKTTLANALCRDPDVRFEFSDGILRVEIGKERTDVLGLVLDLTEMLDPQGRRPGFAEVQTAAEHLGELIGEARLLLVIDDVWREAQLRPFLVGGPNCVRLVTTRTPQALPQGCVPVEIDEMRAAEAASLISGGLPVEGDPAARGKLVGLADRLGNWAQMLAITNGWLRERVTGGEPLTRAIESFEQRLDKRGVTAFDPKDAPTRDRAIRACVEASIEDLQTQEAARLGELAILPEDADVPLGVVEALWAETGDLNDLDADDLMRRLRGLSLLQQLDLGSQTLRLHDNMIWYLRDQIGPDGYRAAHEAMVRALYRACAEGWATLPSDHAYGWRFMIRHLRGAGRDTEADRLLLDYAWIRAKLAARSAQELLESYLPPLEDEAVRQIGRAIALSAPVLARDPRQLGHQLFGRLGQVENGPVGALVDAAQRGPNFWPAPRWPGLDPPGGELLRIRHAGSVRSAAFASDGARIVTASSDATARVWDATSGAEITVLRGHKIGLNSAAFAPDGTRIVTASWDNTARIWDAVSGAEIAVLRHSDIVNSAAFAPDGTRIVTASRDKTARIWDAVSGAEIAVLRGHNNVVSSAAFAPGGARVVTASWDGTARTWDATSGAEIAVLRGHKDVVQDAAFAPDGTRIVTASWDNTARIWDAVSGAEVTTFCGHRYWVQSAAFSPDGARIVTASSDSTARIWDATSGAEISVLRAHGREVLSAAFAPDGARIVTTSKDGTARIWNAVSGPEIAVRRGHDLSVNSAAFAPDGARIVTASTDHTARIWDAASGAGIAVLRGHDDSVRSAVFAPDGARIVTASFDSTARIWDATSGAEISVLRAHYRKVLSAAFAPDGVRIVTTSEDGTVRISNAASGAEIAVLPGHDLSVSSAAFAPDGARIVTTTVVDNTARVWDATSGAEITVLRGHSSLLSCAAFAPDGTRIVTASWDSTARIWDAVSGAEIAVLRGHDDLVLSAAFAPGCARVVTASRDNTARIWDAASGVEIAAVTFDAALTAVAVQGDAVALGDMGGRVHVLDLVVEQTHKT
jgi:WD40 repeat protein